MSKNAKLNSQYSALQGAYWMSFGLIISFAAVFLHDRGYSNSELGIILALGNIAAFILQPIVADFADRSKKWSLPAIIAAITLGSILASLLGGVMFDRLGMSTTLLVSAVITAVGVALALPAIRRTR